MNILSKTKFESVNLCCFHRQVEKYFLGDIEGLLDAVCSLERSRNTPILKQIKTSIK